MEIEEQRMCKRCCGTFSTVFFRKKTHHYMHIMNSAICFGCETTARTEKKRRNRPLEKARSTLHRHADKYIRLKMADNRDHFAERYGWDLERVAHDIKHEHGNNCGYCYTPYREMGNGLSDVTLDIVDTDKQPFYGYNTKWVCATCNREKQKTDPTIYGAKQQAWKAWHRQQDRLKNNPESGLPLFDVAA